MVPTTQHQTYMFLGSTNNTGVISIASERYCIPKGAYTTMRNNLAERGCTKIDPADGLVLETSTGMEGKWTATFGSHGVTSCFEPLFQYQGELSDVLRNPTIRQKDKPVFVTSPDFRRILANTYISEDIEREGLGYRSFRSIGANDVAFGSEVLHIIPLAEEDRGVMSRYTHFSDHNGSGEGKNIFTVYSLPIREEEGAFVLGLPESVLRTQERAIISHPHRVLLAIANAIPIQALHNSVQIQKDPSTIPTSRRNL